jgi:serine/threonine protein kinase
MLTFDRTKVLGKGAFGIVYEGVWDGNTVAVKRIPIDHAANDEREEKALKILNHINVNKLLHVEMDQDFKY